MAEESERESLHPCRLTSFRVREIEDGVRLMLSRDGDITFDYDFSHSQIVDLKTELEVVDNDR